jgi:hypothetical protein
MVQARRCLAALIVTVCVAVSGMASIAAGEVRQDAGRAREGEVCTGRAREVGHVPARLRAEMEVRILCKN